MGLMNEDFEFCEVRWGSQSGDTYAHHVCAEHKPGHRVHTCCCGDVEGL